MDYTDFNIQIPYGKNSGEITCICPKCSHTRKKSKDKCLGVNLDKKVWRCNHCGWTGFLKNEMPKIEYKKPIWLNKTGLNQNVVQWFEKRGITQKTLLKSKISDGIEYMPQTGKQENTMHFNYFRENELINVKYRDNNKNFKLYKEAELIFYNLDSIKNTETCFIVEGEIDCLTLIEAGIDNVVSVPNGANLNSNNLQYLDNCYDYFVDKKEIILWLDNDIAGRKLKFDLAERLGLERCKYIELEDCKDANEYLLKHGLNAVITISQHAKFFPLDGVLTISDISNEIDDMYINGLDKGVELKIPNFNLNIVKGYLTIVTGIPSHGKALSIETDIPTPTGFIKMKDISIGNDIYDEKGNICQVTNITDVMYERPCYELIFNDGEKIIADENHKWLTDTWQSRRSKSNKKRNDLKSTVKNNGNNQSYKRTFESVKNTLEIFNTLKVKNDNRANHSIKLCEPLKGIECELELSPYLLGAWLGDGRTDYPSITITENGIYDKIILDGYNLSQQAEKIQYGIIGVKHHFRNLNLLGNKHIPVKYLRASIESRLDLLKGLMDTDGYINPIDGRCEFCSIKKELAENVYELVASLGIRVTIKEGNATLKGKIISKKYRVQFTTTLNVFGLERKSKFIKSKLLRMERYIVSCEKIESVPVRCISVNSESKLFLCTKSFIPTHNSDFLDYICLQLRILHDWKGCFYSPENRPTQLHFSKMVRKISGKHWDGYTRILLDEVNEIKQYLDRFIWFLKPEKDFSLTSILKQIANIKQRYGLDYFVIDAWNKLEHKEDSTSYIGKAIDEIVTFCELNNVHCFLVAHPTKIKKNLQTGLYEIPTLYDIAGSANFYNKADNGICVYRYFPNDENEIGKTQVHIQKIKFDHWGTESCAEFQYDLKSKRYFTDFLDNSSWIKPKTLADEMREYISTKENEFDIF